MAQVHQARQALGQRLRELRLDARLTGRGLAERLNWPQPRVSKIETGKQPPTEDDIIAWTQATGTAHLAAELIARLRSLETMYAEWRRQLRAGTRAKQQSILEREAHAKVIRAFECALIPGLLQTPEYARHRLEGSVRRHGIPDDVDDGVRVRMQRQEVLYQAGRRFHFVLTEAALRYRLCPVSVMVGQLDKLMAVSAMRSVRLGIIPFGAALGEAPKHGFWIFDDDLVLVETVAAELALTQAPEIALYATVFERLASSACYGSDGLPVIARAQADVSETV